MPNSLLSHIGLIGVNRPLAVELIMSRIERFPTCPDGATASE
jgi:hypothetical protein